MLLTNCFCGKGKLTRLKLKKLRFLKDLVQRLVHLFVNQLNARVEYSQERCQAAVEYSKRNGIFVWTDLIGNKLAIKEEGKEMMKSFLNPRINGI